MNDDEIEVVAWQTINTAPRDGTRVLILIPEPKTRAGRSVFLGRVRIARWCLGSFKLDGSQRFLPKEIEAWMPLPIPPISIAQSANKAVAA